MKRAPDILNLLKARQLFFVWLLLVCISANAQFNGYPIRNYTPKEYNGFTQNWDCVQDRRGVMYFGNSSVILEYDGKTWRKIKVSDGVAVRSVFMDVSGTIYVGSVGEFGYLEPHINGTLIYRSLSKDLPESLKKFADVWKIHSYHGSIIFQSSENLFFYKDGKISVITPTNSYSTLSFTVGENFYVRERLKGLMKLTNGKMSLVPGGDVFYDQPILGIINYMGKKLVLTGEKGFYLMDEKNKHIEHLDTKVEEMLNANGVLGIQWLNDSSIYINSRIGLIFLNNKLEFQKIINKTDGLNDQTIAQMYIDQQKEVWLSTNNGVSRVSINSPLYYYNTTSGYTGSIQSMIIHKDKIVVGTSVGMFQAPINKQNGLSPPEQLKFSQINGTFFEGWNFHQHQGVLLSTTSDGLFKIIGDNAIRITKPYANDASTSVLDSNLIYVAEKGGLRLMRSVGAGNYQEVHFFEFTADDIMSAEEFKDPDAPEDEIRLWLTTRNKGVLKMVYNKKTFEYKITHYDTFDDVLKQQVQFVREGKDLFFCSIKGSFVYDKSKDDGKQNCFVPKKPMNYSYDQSGVHPVYWDTITQLGKKASLGMLSIEEAPYTFYQDNENILWIGLTNQMVRFDGSVDKNYKIPFRTLIRKVSLGNDSLIFGGTYSTIVGDKRVISAVQGEDQIPQLAYKNNSVTFEYSAAFYEREDQTRFSYRLIGFDTTWSVWSPNALKQYTNLFEGEYTFQVRSRNVYQQEGEIASYSFHVDPPWYRTFFAYTLYVLAFLLLTFLIVKLSIRRLVVAKEKLERIVTERTAEVVQQKEELQQKNTIIEVAYNDIKSSINYAKRIQESILPLKQQIAGAFPDSFVLFKPRDVVSGDFYWFVRQGSKKIIACVDCTGHGVPGAFMSMIGNTLLNEIVNEKNITKPSEILNLLHERVRQSLKQDLENNETRDGMDLALCVFDEKNRILEYAGANRPIYLIRDGVLEEVKPTKSPIGGDQIEEDRKFVNNEIKIQPGDAVYMSTDGYADQFGGPKGKKFMVKRFHQTLLEIQSLPMEKQGAVLEKTLKEWQGEIEQVDDILVMGIKLE